MEINAGVIEVIFFVVLGLFFVTLAGLIVYLIVARRREQAKRSPLYGIYDKVPEPAARMPGLLMSLVREEVGGPLIVDVEGTRYRTLAEVEDPGIRRKIVTAAMDLIRFTGVLGEGPAEVPPLQETGSWREDLRQESQEELQRARSAPSRQSSATPEEVEEQFLNLLSELGQTSPPADRPNIASAFQARYTPAVQESDEPQGFVDQIDQIVQRRIQMIPALQKRGLHVRPGPGGKVLFLFEGQQYQNVDDVPNLTARELIKDAIREWDETT